MYSLEVFKRVYGMENLFAAIWRMAAEHIRTLQF